ncbi:MAG: helix-turn-helix transcriptional regulator [Clostridia bacterium]|nr:helix-turn-helix transcriptional regulator [Clostridia bacterium]
MQFGEKLKALRTERKWSQSEAANKIGVSLRTYQNYESCRMQPKKSSLYGTIAGLFGVTTDYLLQDEEIRPAAEAPHPEVDALIRSANALFAGGELSEDDKEKVLLTINELYWRAKAKNQ